MSRIAFAPIVTALLFAAVALTAGCQSADTKASSSEETTTVSAVCPVMGTKIPDVSKASGKSEYKGKTYYFCCPGCKPAFDKDPEKYVGKSKKEQSESTSEQNSIRGRRSDPANETGRAAALPPHIQIRRCTLLPESAHHYTPHKLRDSVPQRHSEEQRQRSAV